MVTALKDENNIRHVKKIELEQILESNRNITLVILVNLIMGILAIFIMSLGQSAHYVALWSSFLLSSIIFRVLIRANYKNIKLHNLEQWKRVFIATSLYSGIIWGTAGILMAAPGNEAQQGAVAFILGGMAAGAVTTHSSIIGNYHAFILPLLLPLLYFTFDNYNGDPMEIVKGIMIVTYIFILTVFSIKFRRLQFEKSSALLKAHDLIIKLNRSEKKMADLALHDALTGLFNRASFNEKIVEELNRCQRYERTAAILIIDIDHFKQVNDTYGHLIGDEVLKWTAILIRQSLRKSDYVARYGGEEFVIISPESGLSQAKELGERILQNFREQVFISTNQQTIELTVSIGLALSTEAEQPKELTAIADANLYRAKNSGRNKLIYSS